MNDFGFAEIYRPGGRGEGIAGELRDDNTQAGLVRALVEVRDYLEFSAERADFQDNEDYLAVRNYIQLTLKEIQEK